MGRCVGGILVAAVGCVPPAVDIVGDLGAQGGGTGGSSNGGTDSGSVSATGTHAGSSAEGSGTGEPPTQLHVLQVHVHAPAADLGEGFVKTGAHVPGLPAQCTRSPVGPSCERSSCGGGTRVPAPSKPDPDLGSIAIETDGGWSFDVHYDYAVEPGGAFPDDVSGYSDYLAADDYPAPLLDPGAELQIEIVGSVGFDLAAQTLEVVVPSSVQWVSPVPDEHGEVGLADDDDLEVRWSASSSGRVTVTVDVEDDPVQRLVCSAEAAAGSLLVPVTVLSAASPEVERRLTLEHHVDEDVDAGLVGVVARVSSSPIVQATIVPVP